MDMGTDVLRHTVRNDQCQDEQGNINDPQVTDTEPDGDPVRHDHRIDHHGNQAHVKYRQSLRGDAGIIQGKACHDDRYAQQDRYDQIREDVDPVFCNIHAINYNAYPETLYR